MTDMNKVIRFLLLAGVWWLPGCSDDEAAGVPGASGYESESVLQLHSPLLAGGRVDWTRETTLLQSAEVFSQLSDQLGVEAEKLRKAVRFEIDVLEEQVRVIVRDEDAGTAEKICRSYADLFLEFRKAEEIQLAGEALEEVESMLALEEAKVKAARAEIEKLLRDYDLPASSGSGPGPTLERDRLTYQKALEALREAEDEEVQIPEDGVLYRNEE